VWSGFASTSVFVEYKPRSVGFHNKNRNFKHLRAQLTHFEGGGDASDDRNRVLQAKLLQLGAEGVLLVLEEHGGRGRQQLLPGELVGWRLGRRRRLHPFVEQRREGTQFLRHVSRVLENVRSGHRQVDARLLVEDAVGADEGSVVGSLHLRETTELLIRGTETAASPC
jgi:hypothetical protein